jgi:NitT/TauT family transport system substrate-binding protein
MLTLTAVAGGPPAPAWAQAGPRTTLRVGSVSDGVYYLPLYMRAERFLAEEGIDAPVVSLPSGPRLAAGLAAGSVDVAVLGLESALTAIRAGHGIRVFYAPRVTTGFSWFARSGIAGWSSLRGGTVGITTFGSRNDLLTRFALRRHRLKPAVDVSMVQVGSNATRLAALRAGRVDATMLYPPFTYTAQQLGLPLLGTQDTEVGEPWPESVFAAREQTLVEQPAALRGFLRAYVRSVRQARLDRETYVEMIVSRLKLSRSDAERVYADIRPTLDESGAPRPAALAVFWQVVAEDGELGEPWSEARYLDRRFIDTFEEWAPPR